MHCSNKIFNFQTKKLTQLIFLGHISLSDSKYCNNVKFHHEKESIYKLLSIRLWINRSILKAFRSLQTKTTHVFFSPCIYIYQSTFWLREEPKESACCISTCVRLSVMFLKRTSKACKTVSQQSQQGLNKLKLYLS